MGAQTHHQRLLPQQVLARTWHRDMLAAVGREICPSEVPPTHPTHLPQLQGARQSRRQPLRPAGAPRRAAMKRVASFREAPAAGPVAARSMLHRRCCLLATGMSFTEVTFMPTGCWATARRCFPATQHPCFLASWPGSALGTKWHVHGKGGARSEAGCQDGCCHVSVPQPPSRR